MTRESDPKSPEPARVAAGAEDESFGATLGANPSQRRSKGREPHSETFAIPGSCLVGASGVDPPTSTVSSPSAPSLLGGNVSQSVAGQGLSESSPFHPTRPMAGFPAQFGATLGARVSVSRPPLRAVDCGWRNLLTVPEVAARLALSHATVYRMLERGDLPCVSIGRSLRVVGAELDAFLARRRSGGRPRGGGEASAEGTAGNPGSTATPPQRRFGLSWISQ